MKAIIEFNLPEDGADHVIAIHALDFALVCYDISNMVRNWLKYGHEFKTPDDAIEAVREQLCEFLDIHNVNLDMVE